MDLVNRNKDRVKQEVKLRPEERNRERRGMTERRGKELCVDSVPTGSCSEEGP